MPGSEITPNSSEGAQECSPRRKPWVAIENEETRPEGAKETLTSIAYHLRRAISMSSIRSTPLTALLDTGIFSHSEFAETATIQQTIRCVGTEQTITIQCLKRKRSDNNGELQTQIDALPTVGRLIREGVIEAYEYREIWCERMRYRPLLPFGNALRGCEIVTCMRRLSALGSCGPQISVNTSQKEEGKTLKKGRSRPAQARFPFLKCCLISIQRWWKR